VSPDSLFLFHESNAIAMNRVRDLVAKGPSQLLSVLNKVEKGVHYVHISTWRRKGVRLGFVDEKKLELIHYALLNMSPQEDRIGRCCKVGKETILGMLKALEIFVNQDFDDELRMYDARAQVITDAVKKFGVTPLRGLLSASTVRIKSLLWSLTNDHEPNYVCPNASSGPGTASSLTLAQVLCVLILNLCASAQEPTFTTFNAPGVSYTFPFSITPAGAITGTYHDANLLSHGFLHARHGTLSTFRRGRATNPRSSKELIT
jgi:hypothetical protein